jgi:hypothetical protein
LDETNTQACLTDLARSGYVAVVLKLCPSELGLPKRRPRLFFLGGKSVDLATLKLVAATLDCIVCGNIVPYR